MPINATELVQNTSTTIHGQVVDYDKRVAYYVVDRYANRVFEDQDGEPAMKLEDVEALIIENEQLKDTLYHKESEHYTKSAESIRDNVDQSTSNILRIINLIEAETKKTLTGKDCFNIIYKLMAFEYNIDFKECPAHTSKLNWLWENGYAPHMSMYANLLLSLVRHWKRHAATEFYSMCDVMKKSKKSKKSKRRLTF